MNPDCITLNAFLWRDTPARQREHAVAHELGHHDTGAIFFWVDDPQRRAYLHAVEAIAERAGLARLIPEAAVIRAIAAGCTELYEFAEAWRVDESTAQARLEIHNPAAFRR